MLTESHVVHAFVVAKGVAPMEISFRVVSMCLAMVPPLAKRITRVAVPAVFALNFQSA
jgi:hypothetical protein